MCENISCPFGLAGFWAGSGWEVRFRTHWNFYLIFLMIRSPLFKVSWRASKSRNVCHDTNPPPTCENLTKRAFLKYSSLFSRITTNPQIQPKNHVQFIAVSTLQIRSFHCCIISSVHWFLLFRHYFIRLRAKPWKPRKVNKLANHKVHKFAINQSYLLSDTQKNALSYQFVKVFFLVELHEEIE